MTWTAATETNLDFESSTLGLNGANPGWTSDVGNYLIRSMADDGGTKGFRGSDSRSIISRTLTIPADSKRVRLTAWLGRENGATRDQCCATVYFFDGGGALVGGMTLGSLDNSVEEIVEYIGEAIIPATTATCKLEVAALGGPDGGSNNGGCASVNVEWFIDAALTIYETPSFLTNGDFELGDSPPTGWEHVSGNGLISTTDSNYVFEGTYGGHANNSATQISQQTAFNVPSGADQVYFYFVAMTVSSNSADRPISRLIFFNDGGTELDRVEIQGPTSSLTEVPQTTTATTIPVGTTKVVAQVELVLASGSVVAAGFDAATLVFTSETGPIDVTPKFYVRQTSGTWLHLNPVFAGAGVAGLAPDPVTESGNFLRDDGTWQAAGGGGGGHVISEDLVDFTQRTNLDFEGNHFTITDDGGNDATLVALDAAILASLALADTSLQPADNVSVLTNDAGYVDDAGVSANSDVSANTAARHDAVTVTDSAEIDFTLTGQDITAILIAGSIDVLKLDAGVQTSLGLADSALQNVVEDTTPQLGGDLDGQDNAANSLFYVEAGSVTGVIDQNYFGNGVFRWTESITMTGTASNVASAPAMIDNSSVIEITNGTNAFGGGATFRNTSQLRITGGTNLGGVYTLVDQVTISAETGSALTNFGWISTFIDPSFQTSGAGSTLTLGSYTGFRSKGNIGPGVTVTNAAGYNVAPLGNTGGTLIARSGYYTEPSFDAELDSIGKGAHVALGALPTDGPWNIYQAAANTLPNRWNASHFHKFNSYSTSQNITAAHGSAELTGTTARTFTLTTPAAGDTGRRHKFYNSATANLTIATAGAEQVGGAATQIIGAGGSLEVEWNGTGWVI